MLVNESILRDILRLFVWFPFRWLVKMVPVDWSFFFFKLIGDLHFYASGEKQRKISHNIKTILNTDKNAAMGIVKKYYEIHYLDRLHIFLYPKLATKEKVKRYVHFENIELLDEELRGGRCVLLVQPHFGPVQITLLALALFGYNPIQIGYPSDRRLSRIGKSVAYKYRLKYEGMLPAPIIAADKYLGRVYKHLLTNGVVLTTGDGAGGGVFLGEHKMFKFLGKERLFPLGPATWAVKTGATFIPTFIVTEKYNRFRIVFEDPIEGIYNDFEKDRIYITERFISIAEHYVKKYPYCWHFWDEVSKIE